jgi:diaminohydroxyphosphoribosylaminopyrimidine deaminase/5-amino-6-(5-phosphoribosylamino)uracil reductase
MNHVHYMQRCLQLARFGQARVAPNPMVGALLVFNDQIIGEGWHGYYGGPHAEVLAVQSVAEANRHLIPSTTLYVSLEPCNHHGKTPPCTDLILRERIPQVVIATMDPFSAVHGTGIQRLKQAGVNVIVGVLEKEAQALNRFFWTAITKKRPFITLKWAETVDGYMGNPNASRLMISGALALQEVHQWRSEHQAILVGAQTACWDDPQLTNRVFPGRQPIRLLLDPNGRVPASAKMFQSDARTVVFSRQVLAHAETIVVSATATWSWIEAVLQWCQRAGVQSVLVEGGAATIQHFLASGYWDEIRVLGSSTVQVGEGLLAPTLPEAATRSHALTLGTDRIHYFRNKYA